jgi:hypothetical protein
VSKDDDPNSPSYSPRPNPTWEIVITEEDWALLKKINLERTASIDLEQAIHWLNRALDHVLGQHDDNRKGVARTVAARGYTGVAR